MHAPAVNTPSKHVGYLLKVKAVAPVATSAPVQVGEQDDPLDKVAPQSPASNELEGSVMLLQESPVARRLLDLDFS